MSEKDKDREQDRAIQREKRDKEAGQRERQVKIRDGEQDTDGGKKAWVGLQDRDGVRNNRDREQDRVREKGGT